MSSTSRTLACPDCCKADGLSTIEKITGYARIETVTIGAGEVEVNYEGHSEVDWDSSQTIGGSCECGWTFEGDWKAELIELYPCKFCGEDLHQNNGTWVDFTDGDACEGDEKCVNENMPHLPLGFVPDIKGAVKEQQAIQKELK